MKKLESVFFAGCVGGLISSLGLWLFNRWGVTAAVGVSLTSSLSADWLFPRLIWGGVWGFLFLLPLFKNAMLKRAFLMSLGPSAVQLLIIFPIQDGQGVMGFGLGMLTPVFVVFFNFIWGLTAVVWLKLAH